MSMPVTTSRRVFDCINSELFSKFESKFPNTNLNQWAKQLIRDVLEGNKILVDSYEFKSKNQEIEILNLRLELLEEKLSKMREKAPPLSTPHVAIGDKDAGS